MLLLLLACTGEAPPSPPPAAPSPAPAASSPDPVAPSPAPASPAPLPTPAASITPLRGWPDGLPTTWTLLTARGDHWVVEQPCKGEPRGLSFGDDVFYRLGAEGPEDLGNVVGVLVKGPQVTVRYQAPQGLKQITVEWGDPERTWLKEGDHRYAPTSDVGKRWPTEPAPGC